MTFKTFKALDHRLRMFLEDLTEPMGWSERHHWAQAYVQGLLLDGERKSIEPLASRIEGADVQALRQFVGQSPWAVEEVQRRVAHHVVDLLCEAEVWVLDEASFPKAGRHSVGVARGALRKIANLPGRGEPARVECRGQLSVAVAALSAEGVTGGEGATRAGEAATGEPNALVL